MGRMYHSWMLDIKRFLLWDGLEIIVAFLSYYKTESITIPLSIEKKKVQLNTLEMWMHFAFFKYKNEPNWFIQICCIYLYFLLFLFSFLSLPLSKNIENSDTTKTSFFKPV